MRLVKFRISTGFTTVLVVASVVLLLEHWVVFTVHKSDNDFIIGKLRTRSSDAVPPTARPEQAATVGSRRLAVVVPTHAGDLEKAIASLAKWPQNCHNLTLQHADLIVYYAGGADEPVRLALANIAATGGRCFAHTKLLLAKLTKKEDVYPKGPSVQFYKLFLDARVRSRVSQYDALALIEWDMIVAHNRSFEELYRAAFGGVEPFWMKGSILEGTNFHETVMMPEQRRVLGHINGNAIYNNTDPAFVEFVNFSFQRWDYDYSYDVALWATIADFPYSWPLWQRYSRKFVTTNLIANVGFLDIDQSTVLKAVESKTLFIHGSRTGSGGSMFKAAAAVGDVSKALVLGHGPGVTPGTYCKEACGMSADPMFAAHGSMSTVCDRTCDPGLGGARFGGFMCGAGDPQKYGDHCRVCYLDVDEARRADSLIRNGDHAGVGKAAADSQHVVMCDTLLPAPPAVCSAKCAMKDDTICDPSCGKGRYSDYNCNWRGYGPECRFCFNDRESALAADAVAKRRGGRVIMCHTYEPPREIDDWNSAAVVDGAEAGARADLEVVGSAKGRETESRESSSSSADDDASTSVGITRFTEDVVMDELCAFIFGHDLFVSETFVTAKSIIHFMPGMRISVAVDPRHYWLYSRTAGSLPGVKISNSTAPPNLAPLLADRYCGAGTRLIYYMNPGEMMSRKVTSKDTHSVVGELLVVYSELDRVDQANVDIAKVTTSVLGFKSPSFSFGTDIVLPADTNHLLRDVLLSEKEGASGKKGGRKRRVNRHKEALLLSESDKDAVVLGILSDFTGAYIPEVLASLAYSLNPAGVSFINPQQWVARHMFKQVSVWDIPLVKPRFGCAVDVSMSGQGYDVAAEMEKKLEYFSTGGLCETGYIALDTSSMRPKAQLEYGFPTGKAMPEIDPDSVSVAYSIADTGEAAVSMFFLSLSSVVERFPLAAEVVVVFGPECDNREEVQEVIDALEQDARFPIRVVDGATAIAESGSAEAGAGSRSLLLAGEHCQGKFVLHLEPGEVLLADVSYGHLFHFGKPVLPFGRYDDSVVGEDAEQALARCTAKVMRAAMDEPVTRRFAFFGKPAYPREAYTALREFMEETRNAELDTFVNWGRKRCQRYAKENSILPVELYERELMGSFLWRYMHDTVYWRATHPLDILPDQWPSDIEKYHFTCDLSDVGELPDSEEEVRGFMSAVERIDSSDSCAAFRRYASGDD